MDINVEGCFHYIQSNARKMGELEGDLIALEGKLKATKAVLMEQSESSSAAMKEVDAFRNPAYMEVVNELAKATAMKTEISIMIKAAFQKIETARAQEYTKRQELKNL